MMRMWSYDGGYKITALVGTNLPATVITEDGTPKFQGDLLACLRWLANNGNKKAQCHLREIFKAGRLKPRR